MQDSEAEQSTKRTKIAVEQMRREAERRGPGYGDWYYASIWEMKSENPKHIFTAFIPVKKGCDPPRKSDSCQYGEIRMVRGILPSKDFWQVILNLVENQIVSLPTQGLPRSIPLRAYLYPETPPTWVASKWQVSPVGYSFLSYQFQIPDGSASVPYGPAFSASLPIYPTIGEAIQDFCGIYSQADRDTGFQVLLPEYRARIAMVNLSSSRITIEWDYFETDPGAFIGKVYLRASANNFHYDFEIGTPAVMKIGGFPQELMVAILSRETGSIVDEIRYSSMPYLSQPGIQIQLGPEELEQIISMGESETLEFKTGNPKRGQEIAITATAMANGNGGTIFLGVDDNAKIVGFVGDKPEETVRNILRYHCEPPLEPKIDLVRHSAGLVIRILVSPGEDRPYVVRDKGIYIRSGSTDRIATRYEIDQMKAARPFGFS